MAIIASESLAIPVGSAQQIGANLHVPDRAAGLVVFAHGSGSSRFSSRNCAVGNRCTRVVSARSCSTCSLVRRNRSMFIRRNIVSISRGLGRAW